MPIFMDHHDAADATEEDIAGAHHKDIEIQGKFEVKYITYWWDYERGNGFCLVDAPDAATAGHVHREAHGQVANAIIPVDLAAVEAFLGRIGDPRAAPGGSAQKIDPGLRAVIFTDIVGSTEMTARLGDVAALELVRVHDAGTARAPHTLWARGQAYRRRHYGLVRQRSGRGPRRRRHPKTLRRL